MSLKPFFTFYGGKWRAAPHYPPPRYPTIVEPFAGSAGYSMRYPDRQVILVERDPNIAQTWRYLLSVKPGEILRLPDIEIGQTVGDLRIVPEARLLVGWWCNGGCAAPMKSLSMWARRARLGQRYTTGGGMLVWGEAVRERIASQLGAIRHWQLVEDSYTASPDVEATWFVDPPYESAGKRYRFGASTIDFSALAAWCRVRRGQVMVCENVGAGWLPFRHFRDIKGTEGRHGGKVSREALWTNEPSRAP